MRCDAWGRFIGAQVQKVQGIIDPTILEAMAIREALSWIKERSRSSCIVESDCTNVVSAINGSSVLPSQVGIVIDDCRSLLASLTNVKVTLTQRIANCVAHDLARACDSISGLHIWGFNPPSCILATLACDLLE